MLTNQSFTDPQGQVFTDAVVRVKQARYNSNNNNSASISLDINPDDYKADIAEVLETAEYASHDIMVTYAYWPSQASFDANLQPYQLASSDNLETTFVLNTEELAKEKYAGMSVEDRCMLYFTDEILPTLTGAS